MDASPSSSLAISRDYAPDERLRVSIELTNICNFTCPFCPQAYKHDGATPLGAPYDRRQGRMSRDVFDRALAECKRVADTVELGFFGEQTLHPQYLDFVRAMRSRNFVLEVSTNVSYVTREMMDAWIDARVDLVRFSLDAVTPGVFNVARPGKVKDFAGRIVGEDERMKAVNDKVRYWLALPEHRPTRLVVVKSSYNEGEREKFLAQWQPCLGVDDRILLKQVLSYGGKIADPKVVAHRCNVWEIRYLMIDWRGVVSPCNLDTNMDLALGNVMSASIDSIYHGALAQSLRKRTGCLKDLTPCRTCVDGNNWSQSEVFSNPLYEANASNGTRAAAVGR